MTIYEEMQALKDSVEELQKKLEEIKEELRTEVQDDVLSSNAFIDAINEAVNELDIRDEEIILLLSVLTNRVDELSGNTMISLRERQLMDAINKRANKIRAERKKNKWR